MKKAKRMLAVCLAVCLAVFLEIGASAVAAPPGDVPDPGAAGAPWYSEAVYYLYYHGPIVYCTNEIDSITGQQKFLPGRAVTREEFVTFLGRLAKSQGKDLTLLPDPNCDCAPPVFGAGTASEYAKEYLSWAVINGILCGNGKGYAAKQAMPRQEMAAMLMRFANYMQIELPERSDRQAGFEKMICDAGQVSGWAKADMEAAYRTGLLNGSKRFGGFYDPETGIHACGMATYLDPQKAVTRAEAAQAVYSYMLAAGLAAQCNNELALDFLTPGVV